MPQNINNLLDKKLVDLEKKAQDRFGANVDTKSGPLGFNSQIDSAEHGGEGTPKDWNTTKYAAALVHSDSAAFNPKLKFMFKVSFKIDPAMHDFARQMGFDPINLQQNVSFVVRHVDRPKVDADYEEVNMYNFRTKVLKSIRHRELSMTLYDDVGNNALSFVNLYRQLLQPIARIPQNPFMAHEDFGFSFGSGDLDTSMRAVLPGDRKTILTEMIIHQIFVERGSDVDDPASWVKVVNFVFTNPKFTNIDIDDMDHENGGNFNIVTLSIDFDTWFQDDPQVLTTQSDGPSFGLGDITNSGSGSRSAQGGGPKITQQMLEQGVNNNAARPMYGLTSGGASDVADTEQVDGLIPDARKKTIDNMLKNKMPSFTRAPTLPLADNSAPPSSISDLTEQFDEGLS